MNSKADVRELLPGVQCPTLVFHRTEDLDSRVEEGRYIAERIPGARFVELVGEVHVPWVDMDPMLDEIEEFQGEVEQAAEGPRGIAVHPGCPGARRGALRRGAGLADDA